jgi:hypothetical protein
VGKAIIQARSGKYVAAAAEAELIAADKDVAPPDLYGLGLAFALCSQAAASDKAISEPERHKQSERYASRSLELLRRAFTAGYENREKLQKDSGLDSLRNRADFKKLVAEIGGPKR